ncbi:MAG: rhodanese-related sulfurtransferase [Paracoccaceae bacterium]|nr:rhodanese-related sulfurtransferase [Paracoccaceae bacterium]
MAETVVATFYRFTRLADPAAVRDRLQRVATHAGTRGSLLVAPEGINGTVSGLRTAVDAVMAAVRELPGCAGLQARESVADSGPFLRMKVRLKREIVAMGAPFPDGPIRTGLPVDPGDWNAILNDGSFAILDTRNDYEVAIGSFPGAINPEIGSFRDFPAWWQVNRDRFRGRRVAMFCTGGIRCEKASRYLLQAGVTDVCQLRGGILNYLASVPATENAWTGECFVFDQRVAVGPYLAVGTHELCFSCRWPLSPKDRLDPRHETGVSCIHCHAGLDESRKNRLRERQRQVELAQVRGVSHFGTESQSGRSGGGGRRM